MLYNIQQINVWPSYVKKNLTWDGGLWCRFFPPLQSHAASQLSHCSGRWPHPSPRYPWSHIHMSDTTFKRAEDNIVTSEFVLVQYISTTSTVAVWPICFNYSSADNRLKSYSKTWLKWCSLKAPSSRLPLTNFRIWTVHYSLFITGVQMYNCIPLCCSSCSCLSHGFRAKEEFGGNAS